MLKRVDSPASLFSILFWISPAWSKQAASSISKQLFASAAERVPGASLIFDEQGCKSEWVDLEAGELYYLSASGESFAKPGTKRRRVDAGGEAGGASGGAAAVVPPLRQPRSSGETGGGASGGAGAEAVKQADETIAATKARHKAWKEGTDDALTDEEKRAWMNAINVKKTAMQDEAVEAIVAQLLPVDSRGNIQIACGGGKTRVGVRAADALITKLAERGDVSKGSPPLAIVVLVPNLALLPQTAREWWNYCEEKDKDGAAGCSFSCTAISVCSLTTLDKKSGKRKELTGDAADDAEGGLDVEATREQLKALPEEWSNIAKTTDERSAADALYAWLVPREGGEAAGAAAASRPRVRLILSTYHSADQVAEALYKIGEKRALLTIFDEAHVTARKGKASKGSLEEKVDFTRALREYRLTSADAGASSSAVSGRLDGLGSERRLFMTATPRVPKGSKVRKRGAAGKARKTAGGDEAEGGQGAGEAGGEEEEEEEALQEMADPATYGPRVFTCTMEEAIERSLIRDYAVCVVGFRGDASARELLQTKGKRKGKASEEEEEALKRAALARCQAQLLALASAMHCRGLHKGFVFHSSISINAAKEARKVAEDMWERCAFPQQTEADAECCFCEYHSKQGAKKNEEELGRFRDASRDTSALVLMFNVRSLGVGVNVPDAQAVGILSGQATTEGVTQVVGRVLRHAVESACEDAAILLPVSFTGDADAEPTDVGGGGDKGRSRKKNGVKKTRDDPGMVNACHVLSALAGSDSRIKDYFRKLKRGQAVFESGGDGELRAELGRDLEFESADAEEEDDVLRQLRDQVYEAQLERTVVTLEERTVEEKALVKVLEKKVQGRGHQYLCKIEGGAEVWVPGRLLRERYPELLTAFNSKNENEIETPSWWDPTTPNYPASFIKPYGIAKQQPPQLFEPRGMTFDQARRVFNEEELFDKSHWDSSAYKGAELGNLIGAYKKYFNGGDISGGRWRVLDEGGIGGSAVAASLCLLNRDDVDEALDALEAEVARQRQAEPGWRLTKKHAMPSPWVAGERWLTAGIWVAERRSNGQRSQPAREKMTEPQRARLDRLPYGDISAFSTDEALDALEAEVIRQQAADPGWRILQNHKMVVPWGDQEWKAGSWVTSRSADRSSSKAIRAKMTKRQRQRLDALPYGGAEANWMELCEKLEAYKAEKGNCNVPQLYAADKQLGSWVATQKAQYKKEGHGTLAGDRLEKLRQLGAIADWETATGRAGPTSQTWEEMYEKLQAYKAEMGDCNVPHRYVADAPLGRWVDKQKLQARKEGHGSLTGERLEKLQALGAIADWEKLAGAGDAAWQEMYEKLQAYKAEMGDCNVPHRYAADPQLGSWVTTQKAQYKKEGHGTLAGDRLEKLQALGAIDDWGMAAAADVVIHVSQYEKDDSLASAMAKCESRGFEEAGALMDGVWENSRNLMTSEHRGAMQSDKEGDGRDHWCMRFCREAEYKDTEVVALRHGSLLNYDIFVSREHAYVSKKRKRACVEWPSAGRKRADACIWLRRRSSPRLGLEPPMLLWKRAALDAELDAPGGLQCALVLEFKYGGEDKIKAADKQQAVGYCNGISKLLQLDYPNAPSLVVPGFVNVYLGVGTPYSASRSAICEYGVRMNENIADIDADERRWWRWRSRSPRDQLH